MACKNHLPDWWSVRISVSWIDFALKKESRAAVRDVAADGALEMIRLERNVNERVFVKADNRDYIMDIGLFLFL